MRLRTVALQGLLAASILVLAGCGGGSSGSGSDRTSALGSADPPHPVEGDIVGGQEAPRGRWPYAAYLLLARDTDGNGNPDKFFGCGGSLIGSRWVLTAAHCVEDAVEVEVWVGDDTRPSAPARPPFTASAVEGDTWVHPDFERATMKNDVALVRLDRSAPGEKVVFVLADDDGLWRPGSEAAILGWGVVAEDADVSDTLLEARVPIVADEECARAYPPSRRRSFDAASMFCAGLAQGGVDACQGDSGGPILVPVGTLWVQAGVVSWGRGCARPGSPGIYARLETLSDSLLSRLESDAEAPVSPPEVESVEAAAGVEGSATIEARIRTKGLGAIALLEMRATTSGEDWSTITMRAVGADEPETVVFQADGLEPGMSYEYRVSLASSAGYVPGSAERLEIAS